VFLPVCAAWLVLTSPGYPLIHFFGSLLPASGFAWTSFMIGVGLFSSIIWSVLFGYVFRRKAVA
jgi:hypothetical protein